MKQLDPKAVWLFFLTSLQRWLLVIIILTIAYAKVGFFTLETLGFPSWLILIILAKIVFDFFWAHLSYRFYKYELTELGFRKELGVIYKQYVTIPYDRIQNVDIYRGILARILGLSDLNIQTAGSSAGMIGGEGRLPGLSKEMAEQLRDELLQRAKGARSQGL